MSIQIIIELLGLLPLIIFIAIVLLKARHLRKKSRRDPITTDLRHLPGSSLQDQLDAVSEARIDRLIFALTAGVFCALAIATRKIGTNLPSWDWIDSLILVGSIIFAIYLAQKASDDLPKQQKLKQGIRAEHATAQELAASLAGDNRIIHDIRCKDFNIDHVVVTPAGVFAVETKSRMKPPAGNGTAAVKVKYNGRQLEFPGWTETKPIEQAARQSKWLSEHLKQATGETFPVFPVLALPGWFVENTAKITDDMVRVINPKKSGWLLLSDRQRIDPSAIQRAAFAIEKLAQPEAS